MVSGFVLCNANQSSTISTNDPGIPNVLVIVTNLNGSFSNAVVTAADGSFSLLIPAFDPLAERLDPLSQVYAEALAPATLPADSTIVLPLAITNLSLMPIYFIDFAADLTNVVYTSGAGTSSTGNWLINSSECQPPSKGSLVSGFVLCNANQSSTFETNDIGIPNVLVIVTNQNGTFSNAVVTAANGFFNLLIPPFDPLAERLDPLSQIYVETLVPTTLPAESTIVFPPPITNLSPPLAYYINFASDLTTLVYTSGAGTSSTGNWLIDSPECQPPSKGSLVSGFVLCDANQSLTISANDPGIPNVRVIVTNQNGTFSNAVVTAANGFFKLLIPPFDPLAERLDPLSQVYVETLAPATLPADSTIVFPPAITYLSLTPAYYIDFAADLTTLTYTSGAGTSSTGNWLINSPECQSGTCKLTGNGLIVNKLGRLEHTFGGNISRVASPGATGHGQWTHTALTAKLLFQSTVVKTVTSGIIPGDPPNPASPEKMIEFSGVGTLKGIGSNRARYNTVYFTAQAEAPVQTGKHTQRYYLRVYTPDGVTRLLVSGDPSNPTHVATMPVSSIGLHIVQTR